MIVHWIKDDNIEYAIVMDQIDFEKNIQPLLMKEEALALYNKTKNDGCK